MPLFLFSPEQLWGIFIAISSARSVFCGGMGGGDIKLMAAAGLVMGLSAGIFATIVGLSLVLAYSVIVKICKKTQVIAVPVSPIFIGWVCSGVFDWIGGWNEKKDILLYLCSGSNYLGGGCPGVLQVP